MQPAERGCRVIRHGKEDREIQEARIKAVPEEEIPREESSEKDAIAEARASRKERVSFEEAAEEGARAQGGAEASCTASRRQPRRISSRHQPRFISPPIATAGRPAR